MNHVLSSSPLKFLYKNNSKYIKLIMGQKKNENIVKIRKVKLMAYLFDEQNHENHLLYYVHSLCSSFTVQNGS